MESMNIAASKSSLQGDIGALSRRSKLGAEKLYIGPSGCLQRLSRLTTLPLYPIMPRTEHINRSFFGNPTVRAVSKLTARIMQITLKIKSIQSVSMASPTLTLLEGSISWPVIMDDDKMVIHSEKIHLLLGVKATPSIWHISRLDRGSRKKLCVHCAHSRDICSLGFCQTRVFDSTNYVLS